VNQSFEAPAGVRSSRSPRRLRRSTTLVGAVIVVVGLSGCDTDSFIDPSVIGRWENTPTVMPVLDRISSIEDEPAEFVATSQIQPSDLIPEVEEYRFGPGDQIEVRIRDYFQIGQEELFERTIDPRGFLDIPRLPAIRAERRSTTELIEAVKDAIRAEQINDRPVVSINVRAQRKQTFAVLGAVATPGTYFIPSPDYRLLEGLTAAGGVNETIKKIYVIRQIPLTDAAAGRLPITEPQAPATQPNRPTPAPGGENLIDLIDQLSKPEGEGVPPPPPPAEAPRPGAMRSGKAIDLPDAGVVQRRAERAGDGPSPGVMRSSWAFVDGAWARVAATQDRPSPGTNIITQRVIEVPMEPLLAGRADVNIVLRPGDVIRVPPAKSGLVYMAGQVARPGPYNLPSDGRLTLLRAIDSAGGLSGLAIPERVDLTRVVGDNRQATIRVNLRAIAEQTQPDLYLKPDDRINVGTNFYAFPLAVIRSGFRASYGFGFILDRNFQGEVFGADRSTVRF
jgi:polysaccharide biosynthesis/export protein